jgi:hypothetical protein
MYYSTLLIDKVYNDRYMECQQMELKVDGISFSSKDKMRIINWSLLSLM